MSLRVPSIAKFEHSPSESLGGVWVKTGILLILAILIYHSVMLELYLSWFNNHYYYHGFLIPLISFYLIFKNGKKLKGTEINLCFYGLFVSALGVFLFFVCKYFNVNLFLSSLSMIIFIMGGLLFTFGKEYLKILLLPILFLLFMLPIPDSVFSFLIGHLQLTAAKLGEIILHVLGVPVYRQDIYLNLAPIRIEVGESCSAMHSLVALSALSVVVAYVMLDSLGKRMIIVASSIPLAIVANGLRLVLIILLVLWRGETVLRSFFHPLSGKLFFLGALSLLVLEASILRRFGQSQTRDFALLRKDEHRIVSGRPEIVSSRPKQRS